MYNNPPTVHVIKESFKQERRDKKHGPPDLAPKTRQNTTRALWWETIEIHRGPFPRGHPPVPIALPFPIPGVVFRGLPIPATIQHTNPAIPQKKKHMAYVEKPPWAYMRLMYTYVLSEDFALVGGEES